MSGLKKVARKKSAIARKPSNSPKATVNRAGGVAFEIQDPAVKLVTMTGGSFFAEPRFYDGDQCVPKRIAGGKLAKLVERLTLVDNKISGVASCEELNGVAREVLATAVDVAKGKTPEDILVIANWLRNEMNIRLTPQVLLVLASRIDGSKTLVRKYAPQIVKRPDEIKTCLLMHRFLFGMKPLANGLANGLSDALSKFGERGLMKYDDSGFPTWKDVLCWLPRKAGWPLKGEVAEYFRSGKILDPAKTPVIFNRKELSKKTTFDQEAKELAAKSFVNWEVLLSQFGGEKHNVWEFLIEKDLVGYMALLRNLRNILEARVSRTSVQKVSDKLTNKDEILRSKQLPFRFMSAVKSLEGMSGVADQADMSELLAAVELACNEACVNIPVMSGDTVIFADMSGSMDHNKVSEKSEVTCKDVASVLCGIVAKTAQHPYVVGFGTAVAPVRFSKLDTVIEISKKTKAVDTKGYNTNGYRCIEWLIENKMVPDRIIFLSDMQMWNSGRDADNGKSLADVWDQYLKTSPGAKKTWVHCVHLNGYGDNVLVGDRVNMVAGFSEKVFTMIATTEGTAGNAGVPTIEQIRDKWTVK